MNRPITLLIMILLGQVSQTAATCKTHLLRSYSFVGLSAPNASHVLCPKIKSNCCRVDDIMKQHKWFQTYLKEGIASHHKQSLDSFNALDKLFADVGKMDFEGIKKAYEEYLQPEKAQVENKDENKSESTTTTSTPATNRLLRLRKRRKHRRLATNTTNTSNTNSTSNTNQSSSTNTTNKNTTQTTTPAKKELTQEQKDNLNKIGGIVTALTEKKGEELAKKHSALKEELDKMHKQMAKFRLGIFCTLCNGENHNFFDLEEMAITYSAGFCTQLIGTYLNPLYDKYNELIKYMMSFSEFTYLLGRKKLMTDADFEKNAKKYIDILEKCKAKPGDLAECHEFCTEFTLNKLSFLFDGEGKLFDDYMKAYKEISEKLTDKTKHTELFKEGEARMLKEEIKVEFGANHAYLKKDTNKPEDLKAIKTNSFNKHSDVRSIAEMSKAKQFFKGLLPNSGGASLSSLSLYNIAPKPIEISQLKILINQDGGLNFFTDSERMDFDIKKEQLITLLSDKKVNKGVNSEAIDPKIIKLLEANDVENLRNYLNDSHLDYIRYVHPDHLQVVKKVKELIGTKKKKSLSIISTLLSVVLVAVFNQ